MSIVIREYKLSDAIKLMGISDDEWAQSIRPLPFTVLEGYDGKSVKMMLAFNSNELVGFIFGYILPGQFLLPEFLYVKSEFRHRGIARQLLAELERVSDCSSSMIFYNKSLHDYYEKQGYKSDANLEVAIKDNF